MSSKYSRALGLGILSIALHGFVWQGHTQSLNSLDISLMAGGSAEGDWHPTLLDTGTGYSASNVFYTVPGVASLNFHYLSIDTDPSISASVDVINNTLSVQTYTLIFTLPISPIAGGSLMGGSTQGGVTDADGSGNGAILSTAGPGSALYFGRIDGINQSASALFPDATSITAGAFNSASSNASFGLPGVTTPGPSVATSIGIEHQFTLTPGDRATFTSVFVVTPVPEPASVSLLAIGGLVVLYRRRR